MNLVSGLGSPVVGGILKRVVLIILDGWIHVRSSILPSNQKGRWFKCVFAGDVSALVVALAAVVVGVPFGA